MGLISDLFRNVKVLKKFQTFRELGGFHALFRPFGGEIYKSDLVRSCIRPLADHTSKAVPTSSDKRIEAILTYNPNIYMSGHDFLAKCRNLLEARNTLFIFIRRDDRGRAIGFYPIPYATYEAIEYNNGLFIKFTFDNAVVGDMIVSWNDLCVLRKDYLNYDIGGEDNSAIISQLDLINTTNQGVSNAVKATANLRGILKNTKTMLDDEDTKRQRDKFVNEYLNLGNEGGIASLDATQEFIPIQMSPTITNYAQMKEFRENVFRYFGVCDDIVMGKANDETMEAFYSSRIEPFLVALSLEMTRKVFTERELGYGNYIQFTASRLQYCSMDKKLALVAMVDRGAMTPNEWRLSMGLQPIEGGDEPIRRLDTATVSDGNETGGEDNAKEE